MLYFRTAEVIFLLFASHRIEYHSTRVYLLRTACLTAKHLLPAADRQLVLVAARPAVNGPVWLAIKVTDADADLL
jgi:hypothetical protein